MDGQAFASLAQIRILLVPVGSITRTTFEKWSSDIRKFEEIRLGDIPADVRDERARFMPSPLAKGHVHLSFPSHPPPPAHTSLSLFRPSEFPLAVVGIATCTENDSLSSINAQFKASLADVFPANSLFPLAVNCFVFEEGDVHLGDSVPGLVVIPSMMGNKEVYVGTLLADLCSQVLAGFATLMQTLESPLGNDYLNSSLFPTMPGSNVVNALNTNSQGNLGSHPHLPDGGTKNARRAQSTNVSSANRNSMNLSAKPAAFRSSSFGMNSSTPHGRLLKILADFFLLAGRPTDALIWYAEAVILFKLPQDTPWHASALEGLATATLLEAWSEQAGVNNSFSYGHEPWNELADKMTQATALYSKYTPLSNPDHEQPLLTYLYCTSIVRHATLLFSVWSAKGWGPVAFASMLHPGPGPLLPPAFRRNSDSPSHRERMTTITGIYRSQISSILSQAHGPWLNHLGLRERIAILTSLASMYSCLEYKRKEAYILRELTGSLMDILVMARDENGESKHDPRTAELASDLPTNLAHGDLGIRASENTEGNASILKLVAHTCRIYGVDLEAVKILDAYEQIEPADDNTDSIENEDHVDRVAETFGWSDLQVGAIREAVAIAEALPDYPTVSQFSLSALKSLYPVLSPEDQLHLFSTSERALSIARRRGLEKRVSFWSGRPIVSVELLPLAFARTATERPVRELLHLREEQKASLVVGSDPFLYNPKRSVVGQMQTVVVQNEPLEFIVTLTNPFSFDLELQDVTLSTSGPAFECKSMSVMVSANSFHAVSVTGTALEPGDLVIRGCFLRTAGSARREYTLPLSTAEEEGRQLQWRTTVFDDSARIKHPGLASRAWEKAQRRLSGLAASKGAAVGPSVSAFLRCKVLPQQPLLRIRRTSLTHGAVMLYDGEVSTIRLTLENVSDMTVDLLRLTFDDSTIGPAQRALDDGNLSVFETYEAEYELIHRPVFSWLGEKEQKPIAPGKKTVVVVNCLGKAGCTSGTIQAIYACRAQPQLSLDLLATRRLVYPVLVTVYHMLECHGMDIVPFSSLGSLHSDDRTVGQFTKASEVRRALSEVKDELGWCLFILDVRNTYGMPFEVSFERSQEGLPHLKVTQVIPPGSTTRILLPIKKILLPHSVTSQTIPILSGRQFVVAKSKLTANEERLQRELFWYREEIFTFIKGAWREAEGTRSGALSLRQQRMSLPMLEALRTEEVRISMSLFNRQVGGDVNSPSTPVSRNGKYAARPYDFVYLRTSVNNLCVEPLVLTMDLTVNPAEHVVHDGMLSNVIVGRLEGGQTRSFEIPLCFLSLGQFEVTATAQRVATNSLEERQLGSAIVQVVVK